MTHSQLSHISDRQLLEWIYLMQIQILSKVNEIDNDDKVFGMNLAADLMGDMLGMMTPKSKQQ